MNFKEFLIVYLAIGAPFAVHFFLRERERIGAKFLRLKTFAACLFWIFYAARMFYSLFVQSKKTSADFLREGEIEIASRDLLKTFAEIAANDSRFSFFAFRETLERYSGLTLAQQSASPNEFSAQESEIFLIAGREKTDSEFAARLVHRRNLLRLARHQIRARQDFLQSCAALVEKNFGRETAKPDVEIEFLKNALCFAKLLYDVEATDKLRRMREIYGQKRQTVGAANVSENGKQEKDLLWNTWQPEQTLTMIQTRD